MVIVVITENLIKSVFTAPFYHNLMPYLHLNVVVVVVIIKKWRLELY